MVIIFAIVDSPRTVGLMEFIECTVSRFLLSAWHGIPSTFAERDSIFVNQTVILPVYDDSRQMITEVLFIELVQQMIFDAA